MVKDRGRNQTRINDLRGYTIERRAKTTENQIISIIPARGGSKGVPGKNIKELRGKPLIQYSIEQSLEVEEIDRTIVSTDDEEIRQVAERAGAEVMIRPKELAADDSLVIDAIRYTVREVEKEGGEVGIIVMLEPTSPIREKEVIKKAIDILVQKMADSVATFSETDLPPHRMWKLENNQVEPFFEGANPWLPRQTQPQAYKLNGQVYALTRKILFEDDGATSFLLGRKYPIVTSKEKAVDIDTELDFKLIEFLMEAEEDG